MNEDVKAKTWRYVPALLITLSAFLFVQVVSDVKAYRYIGGGVIPNNIISVSGEGEVFAVPDVATVSFSVVQTQKDVQTAQRMATEQMDKVLERIKSLDIEDKDIKTVGYNVYPRYEYTQEICSAIYPTVCPPGRQVITGYEVSHHIELKIRDTNKSGEVLGALGELGVANLSSLSFTIDDEKSLLREARQMAIENAKDKAKELAKDLDVRLVRIVNFSESDYPTPIYFRAESAASGMGGDFAGTPSVPEGENRIVSNVTITYEIR
jgi:uncharacterized protein YggE